MIGSGGTLVEVLDDTATELLPLSGVQIAEALNRTKVGQLLRGHRGHAAADIEAIADTVRRLHELLDTNPEFVEIEVNPLMATPDGAIAVDALITVGTEE